MARRPQGNSKKAKHSPRPSKASAAASQRPGSASLPKSAKPGVAATARASAKSGKSSKASPYGKPGTPGKGSSAYPRKYAAKAEKPAYRSGSPIRKPAPRQSEEAELAWAQYEYDKPGIPLMRQIFRDAGFPVEDELALNRLWQYYLRLMARNKEINLTRIKKFPDIIVRHYIDCGLVGKFTKLIGPMLDIGSGPGFPGIPLKILHPDLEVVLGEGRRVRVEFLEEVKECLRLPGLSVYGRQIHESFTMPMRSVITRAVEVMPPTLERVRGCLCRGGRVIFMKGPNCGSEVVEAQKLFEGTYRLIEDHKFTLPMIGHERRLVVFERLDGPEFSEMPKAD